MPAGARAGAAGWKYFETGEMADPARALDLPAFIADPLRARAASVVNATALFMHHRHGLRAFVDAAGIAGLEFANAMAVSALKGLVAAMRPGVMEYQVVSAAGIGGCRWAAI